MKQVSVKDVEQYWDNNPLCAAMIPYEQGTKDFFVFHNELRRKEEPEEFQREVYEFDKWEGKEMLDIGCGIGYVVALYASNGAKVSGIDIAPRSIELSKLRMQHFDLQANLQVCNAEKLFFPDNHFDLVTSYGVLHHTPDTQAAIDEAYRVLKPGGRCIMMFYNKNSFATKILFPLKRLFQKQWRNKDAQQQVNAVDGPENPLGKVYSKKDLGKMFSKFENHEFYTETTFFDKDYLLPGFVRSIIRKKYGWCLYIKCYKPAK
jgi:ubiquinone/menaquinone biosynthesis C-methylase UbiE